MIPKIIHYCWLSPGDPFPDKIRRCMETWKKLAGWEFMLWDTSRFDINSVLWVKQADELELYAFASDYIRHYAVYTRGGIYLDTDIEIIKPFDELLYKDLLLGAVDSKVIEAGCFGAEKGHPYIKKCMEYYESRPFFDPKHLPEIIKRDRSKRMNFIRPILAPSLMENVLSESFADAGYYIYSGDYFTARNLVTGEVVITENTFAVHHFASAYISEAARKRRAIVYRIARIFGENSFIVKVVLNLRDFLWRLRKHLR
jgi:hypothetical protein